MATTASAGHSGTKDFHQVQFNAARVHVAAALNNSSTTDANAAAAAGGGVVGGGAANINFIGSGEGINTVGTISNNNSNSNNNNNNSTNNNNNKSRIGQSMKNQLPVIKPDTLFNGTGIFTIYCFVKDFIG